MKVEQVTSSDSRKEYTTSGKPEEMTADFYCDRKSQVISDPSIFLFKNKLLFVPLAITGLMRKKENNDRKKAIVHETLRIKLSPDASLECIITKLFREPTTGNYKYRRYQFL